MARWDDRLYLQFEEFRTRAAAELLARVPLRWPGLVTDLGCGPGNSTELLVQRWPESRITAVDSSAEMLERAAENLPGVNFVLSDVASFRQSAQPDLVFANAVLQWLSEHEQLVPELFCQVAPGGVLAFQVSRTLEQPTHLLMQQVAAEFGLHCVSGVRPGPSPEQYYDLLAGARQLDIWQTDYYHEMADENAIVRWVSGTGLRPYLAALPAESRTDFLKRYTSLIAAAYPQRRNGRRLLRVPRVFVVAIKSAAESPPPSQSWRPLLQLV